LPQVKKESRAPKGTSFFFPKKKGKEKERKKERKKKPC
jgi:hypothetical protein